MIGWWIGSVALAAAFTADEAVEQALARSVDLAAATAARETARGGARATLLLGSDPAVQGRWGLAGDVRGVSVTQPVSVAGAGLAAHRWARSEVARAEASEARVRLEVAAATRIAWVLAVEGRQRVLLAERALALATRLREGAEDRLRTGDGSLLDARLARLQEAEARSTWMVAVAEEGERLAELAAWTGVGLDGLELPVDPLAGMPPVELRGGDRSDLLAAREAVEAARARLSGERAATLPAVQLGVFYEEEGEELRAGPSIGVTVPLWSGNADGRAAARAELDVARAVVEERARAAGAEQAASARVVAALEGAEDPLDPQEEARAALESVAVGFERGELDLLTAGLLRRQILEGERAWLAGRRVLAEARIAAALAHEADVLVRGP